MKIKILYFLVFSYIPYSFSAEIHDAAKAGNTEKIVQLVKNGVSPDLRDGQGNTPLLVSVIHGRDIITFLTSQSSKDPNALFHKTSKKADISAKNNKGQIYEHLVIQHCNAKLWGVIGVARDNNRQNILHYIAKSNCGSPYAKVIFYTLQRHPELLKQKDITGKTPLHLAIQNTGQGGRELMSRGLDILTR